VTKQLVELKSIVAIRHLRSCERRPISMLVSKRNSKTVRNFCSTWPSNARKTAPCNNTSRGQNKPRVAQGRTTCGTPPCRYDSTRGAGYPGSRNGPAQRACAGEVYASCVDGQDEAARRRTEGTLGTRRSGREGVGWRRHVNDTTSETDSPPTNTPLISVRAGQGAFLLSR